MKTRNTHKSFKGKTVSRKKRQDSSKSKRDQQYVRNSTSRPNSSKKRFLIRAIRKCLPKRLLSPSQPKFQVSTRRKSNVNSKHNLLAGANLYPKLLAKGANKQTTIEPDLVRRSVRIRDRSESLSMLQDNDTQECQSIENCSDCILIEDNPEIIVIDDEDEVSVQIQELEKEIEKVSASIKESKITGTTDNLKDLSIPSQENGEIDSSTDFENTISEVKKKIEIVNCTEIENNNEQEGDDLSMYYEDITASFATTDVPLYETINSDPDTPRNRNVLTEDVIFVSSITPKKTKRMKKRKRKLDNSVIFISEEIVQQTPTIVNTSDFIPLDSQNESNKRKHVETPVKRTKNPGGFLNRLTQPFKKFKENLGLSYLSEPETPPGTAIKNDFAFTTTERKRNEIYNSNTYNPNKEKRRPGKRMIIIDGSNVAYAHSCNKGFSVKGIEIALQYFEKMGHEAKAVVPQHRLQRDRSSDPDLLILLHRGGKIVLTPCKNLPGKSTSCYDDRFILQLAVEFDAAVVSNDNYRDLLTENPAFKKVIETRVIGYTWCKDMFMLPKDPYGRNGPNLSIILNRT